LTRSRIANRAVPADMVDKLRFDRIDDLLATPRAPPTPRFGLGLRLEPGHGTDPRPIDRVRPPDIVEAQQLFAERGRTIARFVAKLTGKLCQELEFRGLGASSVAGTLLG
jgi:protein ImuB